MSNLSAVRVRMYQVGFGDCFLVSFEYNGGSPSERHMLVDFGRNTRPHAGGDMEAVARSIKERTNGQLDLLVSTHRHTDHLSAFASDPVSAIVESCNPRLVVRSWTEDPAAPEIAPGQEFKAADRSFVAGLSAAGEIAQRIADSRFALDQTEVGRKLKEFSFDQIKNKAAVDRLAGWSKDGRGAYLSLGSTDLMGVLPGVEIEVLGPPTTTQFPGLATEADNDPDYWLALNRQLPAALEMAAYTGPATADAAPDGRTGHSSDAPAPGEIGPVRWLTEKIRKQQVQSLYRIVRSLDNWLNNTSLILLVRAGDRRLLLAGDAQVEDWHYVLKGKKHLPAEAEAERQRLLGELAKVDLYKVGHHGSRNASPRTLIDLWTKHGAARDVMCLMSTREGVYHDSYATQVPHPGVINALSTAPLRLVTTLQDPKKPVERLFWEVWAPTSGGVPFAES